MTKYKSYIFLLFLLSSINVTSIAQAINLDSLKNELQRAKNDTSLCRILYLLTEEELNDSIWPIYNQRLNTVAKKNLTINQSEYLKKIYKYYLAYTLTNFASIESNRGITETSIKLNSEAFSIYKEISDKVGMAKTLNNIGFQYSRKGDYTKGIELMSNSLKIQQEVGNRYGEAISYQNIAHLIGMQGDTANSIAYMEKGLAIFKNLGLDVEASAIINNIAVLKTEQKEYDTAINLLRSCIITYKRVNAVDNLCPTLENIGTAFFHKGNHDSALYYFFEAVKYADKHNQVDVYSNSNVKIGEVYFSQRRYDVSLKYTLRGQKVALETGFPDLIKNSSLLLYKIYKATNKSDKALQMYETYITTRDSMNSEKNKKAGIRVGLKHEYEKKAAADSVRAMEEKKIIEVKLQQEKIVKFSLYGGLIIATIFAIFMFNRFKITRKQKDLINIQKTIVEEKQKEIIDSIKYARRIQTSLLTSEKYIQRKLKDLIK